MTEKNFRDHSVGYFKFKALRPPKKRSFKSLPNLALPAAGFVFGVMVLAGIQFGSLAISSVSSFWPEETVLSQLDQVGKSDLVLSRYEPLVAVSLPANVAFLEPLYDGAIAGLKKIWNFFPTLWSRVVTDAARFFDGPKESLTIPPELIAQIRQEVLLELERSATSTSSHLRQGYDGQAGQATSTPKERFSLVAVPSTGSTTQDELIKTNLQRLFSDQVEVRFDTGSSSGVITPIFRDGRRGADYVFVLTPAQ